MLRVALANLRAHRSRLVAVSLAVALSVAFMSAALILNSSLKATLQQSVGQEYAGADLVADTDFGLDASGSGSDSSVGAGEDPARVDAALGALPEVASAFTQSYVHAMLRAGKVMQPVAVQQVAPDPFDTSVLESGRLPERAGELVVSSSTAKQFKLSIGDTVQLVSLRDGLAGGQDVAGGQDAAAQGAVAQPAEAVLVGLLEPSRNPASVASSVFAASADGVTELSAALDSPLAVNRTTTQIMLAPGVSDEAGIAAVREALQALPEANAHVLTVDEQLRQRMANLTGGADTLTFAIMTFATIAVFVSALVISNTFSVIVAQRARELALLRCLGASSQQIRKSVLFEALVMALVASVAGVAAAVLLMLGLVQLGNSSDLGGALGVFSMGWQAAVVPIVVGLLMTLIAAFGPAREATRVAPLAAMRPVDAVAPSRRASRFRLVAGLVLFVGGMAGLGATTRLDQPDAALVLALAASIVSAVGAIMLAIFVVPRLTYWIGRLFSARVPGRLAALNSVRNPRRTAATATALLIGVTLVSTIYTGAAVSKATLGKGLDANYPVDISVTGSALDENQLTSLATIDGVEAMVPMRTAVFETTDAYGVEVWGVRAADYESVARGDVPELPADAAVLATPPPSGELALESGDGDVALRAVRGTVPESVALVRPELFDTLIRDARSEAVENGVMLRLTDGVSGERVNEIQAEITDLLPTAQVSGAALARAVYGQIIDTLLRIVTGLLAVAIVIAVIGVGNTLSLSVIERTRENSLMRALGLTRAQLRWTLAIEALLLSAVAAVAGVVLGVVYGYLGAHSVLSTVGEVPFAVPWMPLGVVLGLAALAGLAASVLPARRAAKLSPIAGLAAA